MLTFFYWNSGLLLTGCFLLVWVKDSQPRFLGHVLVITAALGTFLSRSYDSPIILAAVWYIGLILYIVLNFLAIALSPAQILVLFMTTCNDRSKIVPGIVVHYSKPEEDIEPTQVE